MGYPGGTSGKEPACQCRRHKRSGFNPWEDPLEEEMTTHSSILPGQIPRTEEAGGLYSPRCRKEWDTNERLTYARNSSDLKQQWH